MVSKPDWSACFINCLGSGLFTAVEVIKALPVQPCGWASLQTVPSDPEGHPGVSCGCFCLPTWGEFRITLKPSLPHMHLYNAFKKVTDGEDLPYMQAPTNGQARDKAAQWEKRPRDKAVQWESSMGVIAGVFSWTCCWPTVYRVHLLWLFNWTESQTETLQGVPGLHRWIRTAEGPASQTEQLRVLSLLRAQSAIARLPNSYCVCQFNEAPDVCVLLVCSSRELFLGYRIIGCYFRKPLQFMVVE